MKLKFAQSFVIALGLSIFSIEALVYFLPAVAQDYQDITANVEFLQLSTNTTKACLGKYLFSVPDKALISRGVGIYMVGTYSELSKCKASDPVYHPYPIKHISLLKYEVASSDRVIDEICLNTGKRKKQLYFTKLTP